MTIKKGQEYAIVKSKNTNKIYIYKGVRPVIETVYLEKCPPHLKKLLYEQISLIKANKKPVLFFDDDLSNFDGKEYNLDNLVDCVQISNEFYNFPFNKQENLPYFFRYNMVFLKKCTWTLIFYYMIIIMTLIPKL